tara:strand:- start:78 stop:308 length:231 start_codon:yes stop_codon:yes gene_type:complete
MTYDYHTDVKGDSMQGFTEKQVKFWAKRVEAWAFYNVPHEVMIRWLVKHIAEDEDAAEALLYWIDQYNDGPLPEER